MDEYYCVVTFDNTQQSLAFEKSMKENNISVKLMPVPRQISSSCGIAARVPCEEKDTIIKICEEFKVETDGFHKVYKNNKENWFLNKLKKNK